MKTFKGTKGEWKVKNDFREPTVINNSNQVIFTHNKACYDTTNDFHVYYSHNKMMANAKLIASSPDLLKALKDLVKYCEDNETGAELELAKEAIKKAL